MLASELATAAAAAADPNADVRVSAPFNPALNTILSLATVMDTVDGGATFTIRLNALSTVFRIRCPRDTALEEMLRNANIIGVDVTSEPGVTQFWIDT